MLVWPPPHAGTHPMLREHRRRGTNGDKCALGPQITRFSEPPPLLPQCAAQTAWPASAHVPESPEAWSGRAGGAGRGVVPRLSQASLGSRGRAPHLAFLPHPPTGPFSSPPATWTLPQPRPPP